MVSFFSLLNRQGGEDDDMDCIGAEADDTEIEFIRNVSQYSIPLRHGSVVILLYFCHIHLP